jgi:hypothetical protein
VEDLGVFGEHELRWWQRLAARRLLEHDADGQLLWAQTVMSTARQVGKSWLLSDMALWRIGSGHFPTTQVVMHFGNTLQTCEKVQAPARAWAKETPGWHSLEATGRRNVRSPNLGVWLVRSKKAVYGDSVDFAMGDEAWDLPESVISEGVEPTLVERVNSQLLLTSTAHRMARPLMRGRRDEALDDIAAGRTGALLLEWSAGPKDDFGAVDTWRRASPHWSTHREETIARAWRRVQSGVTVDETEPDPIESFKAQWLNIWPARAAAKPSIIDEPLLADDVWDALRIDAPHGRGDMVIGVEDYFGRGASVAMVERMANGDLFADGMLFPTLWDAVMWVRNFMRLYDRAGCDVVVGASMAKDDAVKSLPANVTAMTTADTPAALSRLRQLVDSAEIHHDGQVDLGRQIADCRVSIAGHGTAIRVTSKTRTDLLRAAAWAVLAHHRIGAGGVNLW